MDVAQCPVCGFVQPRQTHCAFIGCKVTLGFPAELYTASDDNFLNGYHAGVGEYADYVQGLERPYQFTARDREFLKMLRIGLTPPEEIADVRKSDENRFGK